MELLKRLQDEPLLQTFNLVGGTALAFFDEMDFNESVVMTSGKFDWKRMAKRLNDMVRDSQKVFATKP